MQFLGKLGAIRPPCELELAFQMPNELKTLNLKVRLKVEINALGTKKLKTNQGDGPSQFTSAKRLPSCDTFSSPTGARLVAPYRKLNSNSVLNYHPHENKAGSVRASCGAPSEKPNGLGVRAQARRISTPPSFPV